MANRFAGKSFFVSDDEGYIFGDGRIDTYQETKNELQRLLDTFGADHVYAKPFHIMAAIEVDSSAGESK